MRQVQPSTNQGPCQKEQGKRSQQGLGQGANRIRQQEQGHRNQGQQEQGHNKRNSQQDIAKSQQDKVGLNQYHQHLLEDPQRGALKTFRSKGDNETSATIHQSGTCQKEQGQEWAKREPTGSGSRNRDTGTRAAGTGTQPKE
ncbi:expressed unknown protein [Seminavis robusta]|uniref:Uncharacterized protein n=1 Tax=Seminavis robusta TaxID=568900 RepID=A0A9N8DX37_9STRA|nr:expressed unknown protein [Seminavis robusta]|eukprot:Sro441_g143770.1 n/a (142) ;mRNA; f:63438-63863